MTEKYSLYLGKMVLENVNIALNVRFSRITAINVLMYKRGKAPGGSFKKLTEEEASKLSDGDKTWIRECNRIIVKEFLKRHQKENEAAQKKFFERFSDELDKERKSLIKNQEGGKE